MKLEDAIVKSIKRYFEGMSPEELNGAVTKKSKYDKKYFDNFAKKMNLPNYGKEED